VKKIIKTSVFVAVLLVMAMQVMAQENLRFESQIGDNNAALAYEIIPSQELNLHIAVADREVGCTILEAGLEKSLSKPVITIEGPDLIKTGSKSDWGKNYGTIELIAKSSHPELQIFWWTSSDRLTIGIPFRSENEGKDKGYTVINLTANELRDPNLIKASGQIIERGHFVEAFQVFEGDTITVKKQITIQNPAYYYNPYPDCIRLEELGLITENEAGNCLDQLDECKSIVRENGDITTFIEPELMSAILSEHLLSASGLVDPSMGGNKDSELLNYIRKLWKEDGTPYPEGEAGHLRDFVRPLPCMAQWYGLDDREEIILLAHEAMEKMEIIDKRIKLLYDQVTKENMFKTSSDIETLQKEQKAIKAEYGKKVNTIAEKRTIAFEARKSDGAPYYSNPAFRVIGAHWSRPFLSIIWEVYFTPQESIIFDESFGEKRSYRQEVSDFRANLMDDEDKVIGPVTIPIFGFKSSAISFDHFKKLSYVDIHSSLAKLTLVEP
jgi:hypothetical protein